MCLVRHTRSWSLLQGTVVSGPLSSIPHVAAVSDISCAVNKLLVGLWLGPTR